MNIDAILSAIDDQIGKLQQARAMLTDRPSPIAKRAVGRPKKTAAPTAIKTTTKRVLSNEARARIASAQKKRRAAAKKAK